MSNYGSSRSEESCSAVLELLERVTSLHKQLELKESQAAIDMDQVPITAELHHITISSASVRWIHLCETVLSGQCSALHYILSHFVAVCMVLN